MLCNAEIKFKAFLDHAMRLGAEKIATGHYARVRQNPDTQLFELLKGLDNSKDQSYFLHRLNQAQLSKAMFPVGELHKTEVAAVECENLYQRARKILSDKGPDPREERHRKVYGEDAPGPGAYQAAESAKKQYPQVDPNISVFRSGSLQRPKNDTPVPGSGTYSPNMASIYANQRDSGAQMRSAGGRFKEELSSTEENIGPGSYEQLNGSLYVDAQKSVSKSSKLRRRED